MAEDKRTLLQQAFDKSHEITAPQDAIEAWCMISAHIMQRNGYQSANDCFCGNRQNLVDRGQWRCEGSSLREVIGWLMARPAPTTATPKAGDA